MLGSIRNFSRTIYAKILLAIVIIPFVFWGMGSSFVSGNKNVIITIDKEKYPVKEFTEFVRKYSSGSERVNATQIEKLLSNFVGEKLIQKEVEYFEIKLSDSSLSKIIKHQKDFKRENKFSRTEYEKFLLESNMTASTFEKNVLNNEKKNQLFAMIAGGILVPKFLINDSFDKINQKRNIELINLNKAFEKEIKFSDNEIQIYYQNNINLFQTIYKTIKFTELTPTNLTGNDEFTDLFFKKIDEIDDDIIQGKNMKYFSEKFNLENIISLSLNQEGKNKDSVMIEVIPNDLIKKIFEINDNDPTTLMEHKDKYFLIELSKTENFQRNINDNAVKNEILSKLNIKVKRELISQVISKINKSNFKKSDYNEFSKKKNIPIQKIKLESQNDDKLLDKKIIEQIYLFPEKGIIVVNDISFTKSFLIYIDKVENVVIDNNSKEYEKYSNLSKVKIKNELYDTYDYYLKNKYKIDINYKALDEVKNYFIY